MSVVAAGDGSLTGTVDSFDEQVGLGRIVADSGEAVGFHCVAIADGTRRVEVGAHVRFRLAAGLGGRWEAVAIEQSGH